MDLTSTIYLIVMVAIFGGIMFFMNRSQKKKKKQEEEQRNKIQVGDEITTIGGFVFRVISIKEDRFYVESPVDRSKSVVMKWALSSCNTAHDEVK